MRHPISAHETVADLLTRRPEFARVLLDHGMHCVGCAAAPYETVEEACATYGVRVEELLAALNRGTRRKPSARPRD